MSSIFSDGALHPGRDPNDSWWIGVRRPEEWGTDPRPGGEDNTHYDPTRMVLELAPAPWAPGSGPQPSATAADGTIYTLDPIGGFVLRQRPCDPAPLPLPGVGGTGWMTGCFCNPCALALDDAGLLYVVDRGNHRVQVIDVASTPARVVIVLGGVDAWGRPCPGDGTGELRDPVAVAIGPSRVWVGLSAGAIQTYDRAFRIARRFDASRPGAAPPMIAAIAASGERVAVIEAGLARAVRFDCHGRFVDELGPDDVPPELVPWLGSVRFAVEGTRVVGPIDGGTEGLPWHKIAVEADLPHGTSVEVQTWAADAIAQPPPQLAILPVLPETLTPPEVTPWAPEDPIAIPTPDETSGENARLVLSDLTAWTRWHDAPYARGATWSFPLAGRGPNGSAAMTVPFAIARALRVDDTISLTLPTTSVQRPITVIGPREVGVIASGDRSVAYGPGAEVWLLERDGRVRDPARMTVLAAGQTIDLTSIANDGDGADLIWPHDVVALLRTGDVIEVRAGAQRARIEIDTIDLSDAVVTLAAPVIGDFTYATLRQVDASGRLVVASANGWGDGFPPNSQLDVAYLGGGQVQHQLLRVAWSDPDTATVWTTTPPDPAWLSIAPGSPATATDRGRYLWIKLRLIGVRAHATDAVAINTPVVRSLRAIGPRLSYLTYLPAVYARRDDDDPSGAVFAERFLAIFESRLTRIESRFELVARMLDPFAATDDWLDFVASWFDLVLDPSWPRVRRASLLAQIFELYKIRGTVEGVLRFVELYTGHRPALIEGFQLRPRAGHVLGCSGALGCSPLGGLSTGEASSQALLDAYAHRCVLVAYVDDECDLQAATSALRALLAAIVPAHVDVTLRIAVPHGRIGYESTIGLDFILGDDRRRPLLLGATGPTGQPTPILGVDSRLPLSGSSAAEAMDVGIQL